MYGRGLHPLQPQAPLLAACSAMVIRNGKKTVFPFLMTMVALKGLMISRQKNNCLRLLVNRTIIELLLNCIEKLRNIFFTYFIGKKYLTQSGKCIHMGKYFPAWPRTRWTGGVISAGRGDFQLTWMELFCWWKLGL